MSYIPPHKRNLKDPVRPTPLPESLVTKFKKNVDLKSSSFYKCNPILKSRDYISKRLLISSNGIENEVPPSFRLVHVSSDSVECRNGEKPLVLMNDNVPKANMRIGNSGEEGKAQWLTVAEKVEEDLVFAYEQAKKTREDHHHCVDNAKLRLVARFGKILFYGRQAGLVAEGSWMHLNKMFSTDVPTSYLQHIKSKVVASHEFSIDKEKETYTVKVTHTTRPTITINCKCILKEDGRLSMYKAEYNPVRHMVVDVSCIDKNLDMRLMLASKRKITALTEKELSEIKELLDSATVDPNVKGRLKWPLGEDLSADGYKIFEVCRVTSTIYKNTTLRLRTKETDRFNEKGGTGEVHREVTLILKDINNKLQEQSIERACVLEMLRDALGTIWDFLHCDDPYLL